MLTVINNDTVVNKKQVKFEKFLFYRLPFSFKFIGVVFVGSACNLATTWHTWCFNGLLHSHKHLLLFYFCFKSHFLPSNLLLKLYDETCFFYYSFILLIILSHLIWLQDIVCYIWNTHSTWQMIKSIAISITSI